MRTRTNIVVGLSLATIVSWIVSWSSESQAQVCPVTSPVATQSGASAPPNDFGTFATNSNAGVVYNFSATNELELRLEAGAFASVNADVGGEAFIGGTAADIDGDGWLDLVSAKRSPQSMTILTNANQAAPPTPTFSVGTAFGFTGISGSTALVGGDFDGDGDDDVIRVRAFASDIINSLEIFPNTAGALPATGTSVFATPSNLGLLVRSTNSMIATDWNNDNCLDILFGNDATTSSGDGQVSILINDCNSTPTFTQTVLISSIAFDDGLASIGYGDVNGDGYPDVVGSSPGTTEISMWLSDGAGGFQAKSVITTTFGNAQGLWVSDFNLDGAPDLAFSVDGTGQVYYWENEADGTPFDSSTPTLIYTHPSGDMDAGAIFDFDHDPDTTLDLVIGDVNLGVGTYAVLKNTTSTERVLCGEVRSGSLDLGALASAEFAVQSARLVPTETVIGAESITYYMSNTVPETWVLASACATPPGVCATFPTPSGREIRWRAVMCRNPSNTASTPEISGVDFSFDYIPATTQFAAGVVASNGIAYAGAFQDVGDKGKFFAINGDLSGSPLWEAGAAIDAQATRNLYTTAFGAPTTRVDFATPASAQLQAALLSPPDADAVVNWVNSARFGVSSPSKFGSIVNSTAAVMTPPGLPAHYTFMTDIGRSGVDTFVSANSTREILVYTSGKAGMIHAIRSDPEDISATTNGQEAWGFIPDRVAQNYYTDFTNGSVTRYMDGAPTLADVYDGSQYITNLIVGGGEGSTVITSLNVTDSIASGPTPLWTSVIANAGAATTKPAVIRVDDTSEEGKFMVVAASGLSDTNSVAPFTLGKRVVGMDIDGTQQWFFDAACPVTTDITAYETDDTGTFASGAIDGFTDQVVFGDFCGNIYMINVNSSSIFASGTPPVLAPSVGAFDTGAVDINTNAIIAFFSTTELDALGAGQARPIVGGIAARPDTTTDLVLYFGTGGHEQVAVTDQNEFYAIYAKDRTLRSKLTGDCTGRCEKFYGGTVITETQVIFTATKDPVNGTCDDGETRLILADNAAGAGTAFGNINEVTIASAVLAPVFAAANAIYITTIVGEIQQVGQTTAPAPGTNPTQATSTQDALKGEYIAVSGWRQVLY